MAQHAPDSCTTDAGAVQLLRDLQECELVLRIRFLHQRNKGEWVIKGQFKRAERKKTCQGVLEITQATAPGSLTGISRMYYQNTYLVSSAIYGSTLSETQILPI